MGLCCFNIDFDLVISGCNNGWNISYDTMYSGTVGACLEAMMFFKPAIAVSAHHQSDLSEVEKYFDEVWKYIHEHKLLSNEYFLNVNFPNGEVKEIALGNLYYRKDQNYFTKTEKGYMALRHLQTDFSDDKNGDCYQVEHGVISIVPLSRSYFNKDLKEKLNFDGLSLCQNNDYGQEVKHYHLHLIPRKKGDNWHTLYNKDLVKDSKEIYEILKK